MVDWRRNDATLDGRSKLFSLRVGEDVAVDLDVTVLYSKGCPSWRIVLEQVNAAAEQAGIQVRVITRLVETIEDAERFGFPGSPTILIGGRDPFSRPGTASALACRLYSTPEGLAGSRPSLSSSTLWARTVTALLVDDAGPAVHRRRRMGAWQRLRRIISGRFNRTAGAAATRSTSRS